MRNVDARMLESEAGVRLHRNGVSYDKAFRLLKMARKSYDRWRRLSCDLAGCAQDRSRYECRSVAGEVVVERRIRYDGYPVPFRVQDIEIKIGEELRKLGKIARMLGVHSGTDESSAHVLSDCASQFGMKTTATWDFDRHRIEKVAEAKKVVQPRSVPVNIWDYVTK